MRPLGCQEGVYRERIFPPQCQRVGILADIEVGEVRLDLMDRASAIVADGDRPGGAVIAVPSHFAGEGCLSERRQIFLRFAGERLFPGHDAEKGAGLAVQPVRAPVGRKIAAMAPDRTLLHPADRLPDLLSGPDSFGGVEDFTALRPHQLWNRRDLLIDVPPNGQQGTEHRRHAERENDPEALDRKGFPKALQCTPSPGLAEAPGQCREIEPQ